MRTGVNDKNFFFTRAWVVLLFFLVFYAFFIGPFANYMQSKPFVEKIGYVPTSLTVKIVSADQRELVGEALILKVLLYFGGLLGQSDDEYVIPPDYPAMSRMLHLAVQLDPYNMDAYYFAQSILVWDVGQIELANNLLEYGMKSRTWDWTIPYYIGFNSAYFLKDYEKAAKYYKLAGELSGSHLFQQLAGRYLYEAGQTDLALVHLSLMVKGAKNPTIKKAYQTRLEAMQVVRRIEIARDAYLKNLGVLPASVEVLSELGYLSTPPEDPYGGEFYFEYDGKVNSTSKFVFHIKEQ